MESKAPKEDWGKFISLKEQGFISLAGIFGIFFLFICWRFEVFYIGSSYGMWVVCWDVWSFMGDGVVSWNVYIDSGSFVRLKLGRLFRIRIFYDAMKPRIWPFGRVDSSIISATGVMVCWDVYRFICSLRDSFI